MCIRDSIYEVPDARFKQLMDEFAETLELNISILSAALRGEPTGQPHGFKGDVASVAKRNLRAGEMLDGEGGYTVSVSYTHLDVYKRQQ